MSAFSATAAVVVHSLVDLDAAVLETLKAEEFLLVHSCRASAGRTSRRAVDINGDCFLRVDLDPTLHFHVVASVLEKDGLADYHPGRKLSAQALAFANGGALPFQFRQSGALFIYEAPTLDPAPGDLPTVEFDIAVEFSSLDTDNHPATISDGGPGSAAVVPVDFVEIPAQDPVEVGDLARNALLQGAFNSVDLFGDTTPMTATIYDGDPDTTGNPITIELSLDPWTTFNETVLGYASRARNNAVIQWNNVHPGTQIARYIRFRRNGIQIGNLALATPLTIPGFAGIRAPVNALAIVLTWPLDGTPLPDAADLPSRQFLRWLVRDLTLADLQPSANMDVTFHDDDFNPGTDYDTITGVAANVSNWTVAGVTVTPGTITSGNGADPGGWPIESVIVTLPGGLVIMRELHSQPLDEGEFPELDGAPILDLAADPD